MTHPTFFGNRSSYLTCLLQCGTTNSTKGYLTLQRLTYVIALFLLFSSASIAHAQERIFKATLPNWIPERVSVPLISFHYGDWGDEDKDSFNEFNPGLILTWENRALGLDYSLGAYRDSYSATTSYAGISYMWEIQSDFHAGISLSYRNSDGDGFTGFVPSLQVSYRNSFATISNGFDNGDSYGVISFGYSFAL